ncbi:Uncharacterised protein [Nocardia africana]|uniref:Uncharacterized protein n=1 Tax=Nocardia africana TaxID=134964 RepID=A0A378X5G4_9NOCA|nr:Uncharacterised protein [Nocardia africana]
MSQPAPGAAGESVEDVGEQVWSDRELLPRPGFGARDALVEALLRGWEPPLQYDVEGAAYKLGLAPWQFEVAVRIELLPDHSGTGYWSERVLDSVARRVDEIRERVGSEYPVGTKRAAERIERNVGKPFSVADFRALIHQGVFTPVSEYKGWPVYSVVDIDHYCATNAERIRRDIADREHSSSQLSPRTATAARTEATRWVRDRETAAWREQPSPPARVQIERNVPPKAVMPTSWEVLQAKLVERLAASRSPSLTRPDAAALAAQLRAVCVQPADLDHRERLQGARPWDHEKIVPGSPEHIAILCAWLEAAVAQRFAANLRGADVQALLDFITRADCRAEPGTPLGNTMEDTGIR